MKNVITFSLFLSMVLAINTTAQSVSTFINEINYLVSNPTDAGLEIAGEAGSSMEGWSMVFYALDGTVDFVEYISGGIIPDQENGHGSIWYDVEQNSNGGGIALTNASGNVVQFLSYGTVNYANVIITAVGGPANGLTSEYIGTQLVPNNSLQLTGTGLTYLDFVWSLPSSVTQGQINSNQIFSLPPLLMAGQASSPNTFNEYDNFLETRIEAPVEINLFPNPVVDQMQVKVGNHQEGSTFINIFDNRGKLLKTSKMDTGDAAFQINLSELKPGTYIVHIETINEIFVEKIIKI